MDSFIDFLMYIMRDFFFDSLNAFLIDLILDVLFDFLMGFLLGSLTILLCIVLRGFLMDFFLDFLVDFLFYYPVLDGFTHARFDGFRLFYFPMQ